MAQLRWRRITGYALVPDVLVGVAWKNRVRVENAADVAVEETEALEENAA